MQGGFTQGQGSQLSTLSGQPHIRHADTIPSPALSAVPAIAEANHESTGGCRAAQQHVGASHRARVRTQQAKMRSHLVLPLPIMSVFVKVALSLLVYSYSLK